MNVKIPLCAVVALWAMSSQSTRAVSPIPAEMATARAWVEAALEKPEPPFSFTCGGKPSVEVLEGWERKCHTRKLDGQRTEHTIAYTDPESGLVLRCVAVEYQDFPTIEWTLFFKNTGQADSAILENIQALNVGLQRNSDEEFLLHHCAGASSNRSDYAPLETRLPPRATKRFAPVGGRPANGSWPYFNLQWGNRGVIVAVGWPGQWASEFVRDEHDGIRIRAGQESTHFKLLSGEEVRTPLIVMQFWQDRDWIDSQNLWRRWMMAHGMPKPGGKLPPPIALGSSYRVYAEMTKANEQNQLMFIGRYLEERLKIDYWWMDAGWYPCGGNWPVTGTWDVDRERFPDGFKPISEHAHANGIKTLVWFEPERVHPGTWLHANHPEWLLPSNKLIGVRRRRSGDLGIDPNVSFNPTQRTLSMAAIRWTPGRLSLHPGPKGEYSVVRWTAPGAGVHAVKAAFLSIDPAATTDVYVLHNGRPLFEGLINLAGKPSRAEYAGNVNVAKGDTLDFAVGFGNATHSSDSTGLEVTLREESGGAYDAAGEFKIEGNPNGDWSYGYLRPDSEPKSSTFRPYEVKESVGSSAGPLLDLGNPAARQWLTDHVDRLLTEQGIDLYRQDFNMDPLGIWRGNDAADRQGITEIKHVTGYLAYWDELLRRHPNMLIDSCASGGRRNELETMRRSVPLWRSDYVYDPSGMQCLTYGISLWLPYHGTGNVACAGAAYTDPNGGKTPVEPYAFWSTCAPANNFVFDMRAADNDYDALRRLFALRRRIAPNYFGDYYPLTPYSQAKDVWVAWQFHRPSAGQGMVQAFRRAEADRPAASLKLRALDPDAQYTLTELESGRTWQAGGSDLLGGGLNVSIPAKPSAAVIVYERKP